MFREAGRVSALTLSAGGPRPGPGSGSPLLVRGSRSPASPLHCCPAPLGLLKQRTSFHPERVRGPGLGPECSRSFLLACGIGESCCPKALCLLGAPGMASLPYFNLEDVGEMRSNSLLCFQT